MTSGKSVGVTVFEGSSVGIVTVNSAGDTYLDVFELSADKDGKLSAGTKTTSTLASLSPITGTITVKVVGNSQFLMVLYQPSAGTNKLALFKKTCNSPQCKLSQGVCGP